MLQSYHRELEGTERAPCRRRAREAVPSRAWSITQVLPNLALERNQWTITMMPNHLNLQPDHCLAVIARRRYPVLGNRLGLAINSNPELDLDQAPSLYLARTTPSH